MKQENRLPRMTSEMSSVEAMSCEFVLVQMLLAMLEASDMIDKWIETIGENPSVIASRWLNTDAASVFELSKNSEVLPYLGQQIKDLAKLEAEHPHAGDERPALRATLADDLLALSLALELLAAEGKSSLSPDDVGIFQKYLHKNKFV